MAKEEKSATNGMARLAAIGAVILAVILYYVLVLSQHADQVQRIGGR